MEGTYDDCNNHTHNLHLFYESTSQCTNQFCAQGQLGLLLTSVSLSDIIHMCVLLHAHLFEVIKQLTSKVAFY